MPEERVPGKRGPKPKYESNGGYQRGAPRLATRVDPDVLDWIESRVEGTRPYIERLVREDRNRAGHDDLARTGQQESTAEA